MENDIRVDPPETAGERETLIGFLDYFRATVHLKAAGLSDSDGAKQLLPSLTTVSGLVQHLTDVEQFWFQGRIDGQQGVRTRWSDEDPDGEFRVSESDSLDRLLADYDAACRRSREVLARYGLEDRCRGGNGEQSVRWVLVHMIEETGRHCGHLDILRELLDGSTGD
ncbi:MULTISPECIES: DinB family protein [unclassified Arthrobacter]|uniref:DinB family protein n=1 Tax=unclassified Arthrobacter TaxID=235627 RepID=UPI0021020418|nr:MULTISPECIES: DinB family protein [unclassified Arthrobacter]MCQ1987176.1 DinB family protein [Arthrobacter sp. zg-Y844]MCQ1995839.1 DinB family protein [Arthrobacter sp. zg-Y1171]UWX83081.1 DinB family protein [Arthrobacter sp. zg-Y1171]